MARKLGRSRWEIPATEEVPREVLTLLMELEKKEQQGDKIFHGFCPKSAREAEFASTILYGDTSTDGNLPFDLHSTIRFDHEEEHDTQKEES